MKDEHLIEKALDYKIVYEGPIFKVEKHNVTLPNGKSAIRDIVRNPNAVAIIPIMDNGNILMVRQFRKSIEDIMLEIPAGKMDEGEMPLTTAHRELEEETGYKAKNMELLFQINVSPGFSSEIIYIYKATELYKGVLSPDDDEFVETKEYKLETLVDLIFQNKLTDGKTVAGILAIK